jgi:hypothetical protein
MHFDVYDTQIKHYTDSGLAAAQHCQQLNTLRDIVCYVVYGEPWIL